MEHANGTSSTEEVTVPHSHIPYGETGSGHYTSNVKDSLPCINDLVPFALDCVRTYPITPGSVFTIADYGCADGGTSMSLIYACVEELRRLHGNELDILVYYEDQPVNDFTSLFSHVQGLIPGPPSYLTAFPNVYVAASGTQFFKQCFPRGSIQLGMCSIALDWPSKIPCGVTGGLLPFQSQNAEERELFKRQAAADWEMFLLARAKELCSGGILAVAVLAMDDNGQFSGNTKNTKFSLVQVLYDVWRKMAQDGVITMDEVNKTSIATYMRTRQELQLPFMSEESPVRKAGLSLVSLDIKTYPCPYTKMRLQTGDTERAAKSVTEATRPWSNASFLSGLSDERTVEEKNAIVDQYFLRLEAEFVRIMQDYRQDLVAAVIKVQKK